MKNKLISLQEVLVDVQSFCIEFHTIKEANAIYKTLQIEMFKNNTCGQGNNWSEL